MSRIGQERYTQSFCSESSPLFFSPPSFDSPPPFADLPLPCLSRDSPPIVFREHIVDGSPCLGTQSPMGRVINLPCVPFPNNSFFLALLFTVRAFSSAKWQFSSEKIIQDVEGTSPELTRPFPFFSFDFCFFNSLPLSCGISGLA